MKKLILILILLTCTNAQCGEDLTLVCKGITTSVDQKYDSVSKTADTSSYLFKNGKLVQGVGLNDCIWTKARIFCTVPDHTFSLSVDRISGTVTENNVYPVGIATFFKGNCVLAKQKF